MRDSEKYALIVRQVAEQDLEVGDDPELWSLNMRLDVYVSSWRKLVNSITHEPTRKEAKAVVDACTLRWARARVQVLHEIRLRNEARGRERVA